MNVDLKAYFIAPPCHRGAYGYQDLLVIATMWAVRSTSGSNALAHPLHSSWFTVAV